MPSSSSHQNGWDSPSTSRQAEREWSHSRPSKPDRDSDERYRRPRSPDLRSRNYRDDDWRRSPEHRGEDHWRSSRRSSQEWRYSDEYSYSSHRDRRDAGHDYRERSSYDRHDRDRRRATDSSAYSKSRDASYHDSYDRDRSRREDEDRYARRSGEEDRAYRHHRDRRSRSRDRLETSHREYEEGGYRSTDHSDRDRYRDDHSRRHDPNRSHTRSRSRERSHARDGASERRPSIADAHPRSSRHEERSIQSNRRVEEGQLLKRKPHAEEFSSARRSLDSGDAGSAEATQAAGVQGHRGEHTPRDPTSNSDSHRRAASPPLEGSATRRDGYPTPNGAIKEHPGSSVSLVNGLGRHRSRSPPSKETSSRSQTVASRHTSSHPPNGTSTSDRTDYGEPRIKQEPPIERSFGHVHLPHELPRDLRGQNFMSTGPVIKEMARPVCKSAAEKHLIDADTVDPRRGKAGSGRKALNRVHFKWDANSVGDKPLPAPRNLVLTNLSPLTPIPQVLLSIRRFGRVESSKLEMHPTIGQSLGIFHVTFAHDFDERGKPLESVAAGQQRQHAAKAAKAAWLGLKDRPLGQNVVQAFLDRSGEVLAEQIKLKVAEDDAKHRRPTATAPAPPPARVSESPATPFASKPSMPPPDIPRGPRSFANAAPSPSPRAHMDRSEPTASRYPRHSSSYDDDRKSGSSDPYRRRYDQEEPSRSQPSRDPERYGRPPAPTPRAEVPKKQKLKESTEGIIKTLRNAEQAYVYITKPAGCDIDASDVSAELRSTSDPLWVLEGDNGFYAAFKTLQQASRCKMANETLWINGYILQVDARRPPTQFTPSSDKTPASKLGSGAPPRPAVQMRQKLDTGLRPLTAEEKQKTDWTAAELQEAVLRLLQKELADTFLRDVKSRTVTQHLSLYLKEGGEGKAILDKPMIKVSVPSVKVSDRHASSLAANGEARLPTFRKLGGTKPKKPVTDADEVASKARRERKQDTDASRKPKARRNKEVVSSDDEMEDTRRGSKISSRRDSSADLRTKQRASTGLLLDSTDDEEDDLDDGASTQQDAASTPATADHLDEEPVTKGKKGSKAKASLATKKKGASTARKGSKVDGTPSEADVETERGSETATPETELPVKAAKAKSKSAKASAKPKPIPADPFEAGVVEDAEECAYLRLALEHLNETGELPGEETLPDEIELEAEAEEQAIAAGAIPKHATGSARTEGYYRIPPEQKALHLPDRNKATEDVDTSQNAQVLQSARNNRADSRRLVLGIEQHKRETATDTDIFKFNQLRTRKKQLKFAKSPIHDWGLYAMEFIPAGDMVIEYVGEMVRQQVADEREKQYERQGNFSTYLFRVDDDLVVDATHKGNIARLMNHCCTPNCNAKILTLNGEKRIVLFAKSPIRAGEELTYDYKFQSSADDEDAIPCLCGSPGCRRFL